MLRTGIVIILLLSLILPAYADNPIKTGGKEIGQEMKKLGKETGQAFKEGGKEIGQGLKKFGKETGQAIREGGRESGQAAKKSGRSLGGWFREMGSSIKRYFSRN